jgi:arsenite/tail-anchored protein-transporting ATPase
MEITIFAGKGGVGKSTIAAAYALRKSKDRKVLAIDYDGGHSLSRVFSLREAPESNVITPTGIENLSLEIIDPISFKPIARNKEVREDIQTYLSQFVGDYGMIPFCDMISAFFGVPTDTSAASRFASLTNAYHQARNMNVKELVIDVEPTAGLERLLGLTEATTRSMQNLQNTGLFKLTALGAMWPDIKAYLKGKFIQNANKYTGRLIETSSALKGAQYFVVCIPESSPVDEMEDVESVIRSYGGNIKGYVINNIRGEPNEATQIRRVRSMARDFQVFEVMRDLRLCDSSPTSRHQALRGVGTLF